MAEEKRFTRATWQIMEQILEVDNLEDALAGSLEIIVETLCSEAGAIWFLDTKTDRLSPLFHIGPVGISNITVENGLGIEGVVTKTGKSIMMNIVGGMDFLTDGQLLIEGKDFSHPSEAELTKFRREYVGFIFQAYNLMPNLTALENVEFIAELVDDPMSSEEAIAKVKLSERANNYPGQMSGGQQQRVSIARAIVKRPKLILADEPTAALDYTTSIEVLSVIEDIVRNQGTTVMMVTHNVEIAKMADRVVKVRNGRIASIKKKYASAARGRTCVVTDDEEDSVKGRPAEHWKAEGVMAGHRGHCPAVGHGVPWH
ncbi:MAG: ABC transporter ATP-binding protein [Clostridia bacterium]|nr:ABC transporter ATP-binding protein [Clostridia bacterium]